MQDEGWTCVATHAPAIPFSSRVTEPADMLANARSIGFASLARDTADNAGAPAAAISAEVVPAQSVKCTPTPIAFEAIETRAAFDALETEWNQLFERCGRPINAFQTFNWCWHWCNHYLPRGAATGSRLFVVTGRRDGRLALVWPLVVSRRAGFVRLSALGEPVGQYSDLLVDDLPDREAVLDAAFAFVSDHARADTLSIRRVRADSLLAAMLRRTRARIVDTLAAPYLDLASAAKFDIYEQRYAAKVRKNRRRFMRRFEERGPSALVALNECARAGELADLAVRLKRAWIKDRGLVSPALADPRTLAFFKDVATATQRPTGCRLTSLETRGEPAAIEIAFDCKGRRAVHLIVYALKFERMSAGQLLIENSLRNCFDLGITTYDLLAPADAYKHDWADAATDVGDWAHAWSPAGRVFTDIYLARLRPWLKSNVVRVSRKLRDWRRDRKAAAAVRDGES